MKKTPPALVFLAFLVVAVPLGWGLYRSVRNSLPLFTGGGAGAPQAPATSTAPATPTPAAPPK
jgi:hypothetical protein